MTAEEIFLKAVEKSTPAERAAFLEGACGTDAALRAEVESLIASDEEASGFLEEPLFGRSDDTIDQRSISERPGTQIGRYRLLEQIGEGGMGVVFMAEQREPVRRKVALKVIKPGMDSKQVIARFEAERQALAMMDHPNIAKVLDAGATESGRPYFVMELVNGISVTQYCDEQHLTAKERLELFIPICQAVQHAHQKGIIHRDLKPGNVLVALYDDHAVPKIIDFGVAKATSLTLTEKTMFTQLGQLVGTVEYMSPEQAQRNQLDIDTRSDIYSLGVLLYELLTGDTPFDRQRLQSAAFGEMLRIITEEEPPKPSTRVSTLGVNVTAISKSRNTDPDGLLRAIRGDLDWVVMRALEKQRDRRYETAGRFAADVQRFLNGEAIEARPPSTIYRLRKTVVRYRVAFATTAIVMFALLAGMVASLWFANSAMRAERQMQTTLNKLHDQLIEKVVLNSLSGDREGADEAMALARDARVPETTLRMLEGIACYHRGDNVIATECLEEVLSAEPENVPARAMLAMACVHTGEWNQYVRQMLRIQQSGAAPPDKDYESLILGYALMYFDTPRSLAMMQEMVDQHPTWAVARALLGGAKAHRGLELSQPELADEGVRETRLAFELLGGNRVVTLFHLWAHHVAIEFAQREGKPYDELLREAEIAVRILKEDYTDYTVGAANSAWLYETVGDTDSAIEAWSAAVGNADHGDWTQSYVAFLVYCGQQKEALRILDATQLRTTSARFAKGFLLAGIPERREEARELCQSLIGEDDPFDASLSAIEILCLLSEREKVIAESEKLIGLGGEDSVNWKPYTCLAFHARKKTVDEFDAACGETALGRLEFHYQLAFRALLERNQEAARAHFEQSVETGQISNGYYHWAKAFCRLLRDNPSWPEGPY